MISEKDCSGEIFTSDIVTQREKICEIYKSTKGKDKLHVEGFHYNLSRKTNDTYYWACDHRLIEPYKCGGKCITKLNEFGKHAIKSEYKTHNHEPKAIKTFVANAINELKEDASKNLSKRTCQIIQNVVANCNTMVARNMPSTSSLRKIVIRTKNKIRHNYKEPDNLFFELDPKYIEHNNDFIVKDIRFDNHRIILISTPDFMQILSRGQYWMMDGTFKVVPAIFKQLYSIHSNISNDSKAYPLAFALCSGKSQEIYERLFQLLFDIAAEIKLKLDPKITITDFEKGAINAIKAFFPDILCKGCHFHLGQIIYRKIQSLGLQTKFGTNEIFSLQMRAVLALSFLPSHEIPHYCEKLFEELDEDGKKLLNWFNEIYVSGKSNKPVLFPPSFWSCFELDQKGIPRTQNYVESWHHRLHAIIDAEHIGFYRLLGELQKEINFVKAEIDKFQLGGPPVIKRKKYFLKDMKIKRILEKKDDYREVKLLLLIADNLNLK